jgi:rod shape-determining protein MreC
MPEPSNTRQNVMILATLLFLQLLLMSGSVKGADGSVLLESWFIRFSSPVVALARGIGGGISGLVSGARELVDARGRNALLEQELSEMREELRRSREATLENVRLRQMLGMREALNVRSIGAAVVGHSTANNVELIVVSAGTDEGVTKDLPVVAHGCAVGRVVAVTPGHSKIQLLTDPNSGVGAVVHRNERPMGIVVGKGDEGLDLLYVPGYSDVAIGDLVVTSGLDGLFPKGFGLGNIEEIKSEPDASRTMRLNPALDYRALEEVLILLEPHSGGLVPPWPGEEKEQ